MTSALKSPADVKRWRYNPLAQKKEMYSDSEWEDIKLANGWETDPEDPRLPDVADLTAATKRIKELEASLLQLMPDELPSTEQSFRFRDIPTEIENLKLEHKALKQNFYSTVDVALKHRFNEQARLIEERIGLLERAKTFSHEPISYGNHRARDYRAQVPRGEGVQFSRFRITVTDPLEKVVLEKAIAEGEQGLRRIDTGASPYFDRDTGRFFGWFTDEQLAMTGSDVRGLRRG